MLHVGPIMAGAGSFEVVVKGKGGHAAAGVGMGVVSRDSEREWEGGCGKYREQKRVRRWEGERSLWLERESGCRCWDGCGE